MAVFSTSLPIFRIWQRNFLSEFAHIKFIKIGSYLLDDILIINLLCTSSLSLEVRRNIWKVSTYNKHCLCNSKKIEAT